MHHERSFSAGSSRLLAADHDLRREQRRLRRVFTTLVFALAPAALAQACGTAGTPQGGNPGTGSAAPVDEEAGVDAEAESDAPFGSDADGAAPQDAGASDSCTTLISEADASTDAQPLCFYALPCGLPSGLIPVGCDIYYKDTDDAAVPFGCSLVEGEITRENAVEGCVRETFGALIMQWQAAHARDASVRRAFARIAADETRHAALSWSVARWAAQALDPEARAAVAVRCREAVEALRREGEAAVDGELCTRAGLPTGAQREVLLSVLEAGLWPGLDAPRHERD